MRIKKLKCILQKRKRTKAIELDVKLDFKTYL